MLTKEQILKAEDLPREEVKVPEWGGSVFVRGLTALERDAWENSWWIREGDTRKLNVVNLRARLAVLCVCDAAGKRLFDDAAAADLGAKSGAAVDRLYTVALRLSGMQPGAVEEAEKNLSSGQGAGSSSNSPLRSAAPLPN